LSESQLFCRVFDVEFEQVYSEGRHGGLMVSVLSLDRAVWVRALAGEIVLCSSARHLTLMVPLSIQVYKWVSTNLMLGVHPVMDWHPIQGGSRNTPSRFMPQKPELSAGLMDPRGPNADFTFTFYSVY